MNQTTLKLEEVTLDKVKNLEKSNITFHSGAVCGAGSCSGYLCGIVCY